MTEPEGFLLASNAFFDNSFQSCCYDTTCNFIEDTQEWNRSVFSSFKRVLAFPKMATLSAFIRSIHLLFCGRCLIGFPRKFLPRPL